MNEQRQNTREAEARSRDSRPVQARAWAPASSLPTPREQDGYRFRWIRRATLGQSDPTNMSKRMREGWEPVKASEHPDLKLYIDQSARSSDLVEVGGLILCKTPLEFSEQRRKYYEQAAQQQMEAVDNQYMKEQDIRMPLFNQRESKVTFGKGR